MKKLRFGLVLESRGLEPWQRECLAGLLAVEGAVPAALLDETAGVAPSRNAAAEATSRPDVPVGMGAGLSRPADAERAPGEATGRTPRPSAPTVIAPLLRKLPPELHLLPVIDCHERRPSDEPGGSGSERASGGSSDGSSGRSAGWSSGSSSGRLSGRSSERSFHGAVIYPAESLRRIRELELDFILRFGYRHLSPELAAAARFGFWSFYFGWETKGRREPVGFWEVRSGERTIAAALHRLTARPGEAVPLRRGVFRTKRHSIGATRRRVLAECAGWPARTCRAILLGNTEPVEGPAIPVAADSPPKPSVGDRLAALGRSGSGLITRLLEELVEERWNIGLVDAPIASFLQGWPSAPIRWLPAPGGDGFVQGRSSGAIRRRHSPRTDDFLADPCAAVRGDERVVLAERFDYRAARGTISLIRNLDRPIPEIQHEIIPGRGHLSFPFVFSEGAEIYCAPESAATRRLTLYRADPFPSRWVEDQVLIEGFPVVDPVIFEHEARWWLLCGNADDEDHTKLYGWHAEALRGPWLPHPLNPLKVDARSSRPAGAPFRHEGRLYRPAQDCSETYGGAVSLNLVEHLSLGSFSESTVARVDPDPDGPYPDGLHSLSEAGGVTVIDGKRHFVSLRRPLLRLLRRGVYGGLAGAFALLLGHGASLAGPASAVAGRGVVALSVVTPAFAAPAPAASGDVVSAGAGPGEATPAPADSAAAAQGSSATDSSAPDSALAAGAGQPPVRFEPIIIDPVHAGDVKLAGDLDGDGFPDLVLGGRRKDDLCWYTFPTWQRHRIAEARTEFTTDGELGDVDGDGDLDVVVPDGKGRDNLAWYENPRPDGDPTKKWKRRTIGTIGSWGKDIELADFDGDGRLDVATRHNKAAMIFFQDADGWTRVDLNAHSLGREGMGSADLNRDGAVDLLIRGAWMENPGGAEARTGSSWREFVIGPAANDFKVFPADLNGDGRIDVLFSSSEETADVVWWEHGGDPEGPWTPHLIAPQVERAHTLQAGDLDLDGYVDVVVGQMHTSAAKEIAYFRNLDGSALHWKRYVIDRTGLHNGVLVDMENDGDLDLYGANWVTNPPVRLWLNRTDPPIAPIPLDRFVFHEISNRHARTFGLGFGDVDRDGDEDIVSGRYIYANPGGDLTGRWDRTRLPQGMNAFAVLDADPAGPPRILAVRDEGDIALYLLESEAGSDRWVPRKIGTVPRASHALGPQGYRSAALRPGGPVAVWLSSGDGVYGFLPPDDPATGVWTRFHVSSDPSDEGLAVADIDADGYNDVVATTGESKGVEWYRDPGEAGPSAAWTVHRLGDFPEAVFPDRVEAGDLDGDGRLDVVVTEENGQPDSAEVCWWAQPPGGPDQVPWERHLITSEGSTNSLDLADLDLDGDLDLVTGEHRGALRVIVWENDGAGHFTPREIDRGHENHMGTRLHDLDGDGDLDLVGIAWDAPTHLWLWRNDAIRHACRTPFHAGETEQEGPFERMASRVRDLWDRLRR